MKVKYAICYLDRYGCIAEHIEVVEVNSYEERTDHFNYLCAKYGTGSYQYLCENERLMDR